MTRIGRPDGHIPAVHQALPAPRLLPAAWSTPCRQQPRVSPASQPAATAKARPRPSPARVMRLPAHLLLPARLRLPGPPGPPSTILRATIARYLCGGRGPYGRRAADGRRSARRERRRRRRRAFVAANRRGVMRHAGLCVYGRGALQDEWVRLGGQFLHTR